MPGRIKSFIHGRNKDTNQNPRWLRFESEKVIHERLQRLSCERITLCTQWEDSDTKNKRKGKRKEQGGKQKVASSRA